jgi:hypothetical protein
VGILSWTLDKKVLSIAAGAVLLGSYWLLNRFCDTYTQTTLARSPIYPAPAEPVCLHSDYLVFPLGFALVALGIAAYAGAGTAGRIVGRVLSFLGVLITLSMCTLTFVVVFFSSRLDPNEPFLAQTAGEKETERRLAKVADRSAGAAVAPGAEDPDRDKQRRTVTDLLWMGTAMFNWLADQVAVGTERPSQAVRLADYSAISRQELERRLVPKYIASLPERDGWGHPYDIRLNVASPTGRQVILLRSPGRDGVYSDQAGTYTPGAFPPGNYDEDLVWADGTFIRWP